MDKLLFIVYCHYLLEFPDYFEAGLDSHKSRNEFKQSYNCENLLCKTKDYAE